MGNGSSPRAWGIRPGWLSVQERGRFIPTCVGNTCRAARDRVKMPVHPHVRGEYFHVTRAEAVARGSSPRAWGIPMPLFSNLEMFRFIPTCVGNTAARIEVLEKDSVHPHVRGEYGSMTTTLSPSLGSSPRAWGIPSRPLCVLRADRFIPTCVGNTSLASCSTGRVSVHPHVRGEYSSRKHEEFSKVIIAAKIYRSGTA